MKNLNKHSLSLNKNFFRFVLILLGLTPVIWFWAKSDTILINGVDTNFPLSPLNWFLRRFYVWDAVANAGRDFSSSTAGLFFHAVQVIPHMLGASLQNVQLSSLIFWFLLIVFSAYTLAKIILPKNPVVQLLFVVLYSFNIYLFNTWENVKVANLSLVAAVPFALSILLLLRDNKVSVKTAAFYSVLVGVVLSGSGINPSYFTAFFLILGIYVFSEILTNLKISHILARLKDFLLVSSLIVLVNGFWILPTSNFIFRNVAPTGSIDKLGFTNWIDSLSENTGLLNIMRLQGAWDWYAFDSVAGVPLYIPYALNYFFRFPFLAFSFLLPLLAILSLVFRSKDKKHLYVAFGLMFIVGVFLGSGTHLPTGILYRWLINNLPFFTLFRSPWYIFTPLVTLSLAALISLLFYNLRDLFPKKKIIWNRVISLTVLIIITGNLVYSYPLVTGKIFRPGREDGFYINFPDYAYDAKEWLVNKPEGRIIGYPDDEIEEFSWRYRGIESTLNLLVDNETLFSPLNAPDSPIALLVKEFYLQLKKGQVEAASSLAKKMAVGFLFEKKDQESLAPELPPYIKELPLTSFDKWGFYEFPQNPIPKIYSAKSVMFGYPYRESGTKMLGPLGDSDILVNPQDSVVKEVPGVEEFAGRVVFAKNSQLEDYTKFILAPYIHANRLLKRDLSRVEFIIQAPSGGTYQPILERYRLEDFGLDLTKNLDVEIDGRRASWEVLRVTDSYVYFAPIELLAGEHQIEIGFINKNLIQGGGFQTEEFEKKGSGEFEIIEEEQERYLSIVNKGEKDISAVFPVLSFDPFASYLVQLKYKQIYGNDASVVVTQNTQTTLVKAQVESFPSHPEWNVFSFYYEPVKTSSVMKVLPVAGPFTKDPLGTTVFYDDLAVFKVFSNNLMFAQKGSNAVLASPQVEFEKESPVSYDVKVSNASGPHIIVFGENYSPRWDVSLESMNGSKIEVSPLHFSSNLYNNAWYLDNVPQNYKMRISYRPQRLFELGLLVSGGSLLLSFPLFLKGRRRKI